MTINSLKLLAHFLTVFPPEGRVADYGGTDTIGGQIVKKMLALDNPTVKEGKKKKGINILVDGTPKTVVPAYYVLDYDNGVDLMKPITGKKFDAGICMDLLEHTENPFTIAENIRNSLNKGALLFVTVPWVWELHYYPKDYWRFAPQGLQQLFSKMETLTIEMVRDEERGEELPRSRLVGVFRKV